MRINTLGHGRILIVDDTPTNIQVLVEILQPEGYEILCAADGETGLELARRDQPDLILLDLMLPGILGIEVLEVLKKEQPLITVVLTTAYGSEETAITAMRHGVNDYIINKRPFDAAEVREVVRRGISDSKLRQENARLTNELESANGQLHAYAGELERTVQDLRLANEQLKELDDSKASFFSMISHELRHPLTIAKGYIELIENDFQGALPQEASHYLRTTRENLDQLAGLIDDLLDLSRMEAGRFKIEPEPISPVGIINHAVQAFRPTASDKGISLAVDLPAHLPLVTADPGRIDQVLTNLLQNALKFTSPGGSIRVSARDTGDVEFCVADTGIGVSPSHAQRIFEPFFQVNRDEKGRAGAGLGLAICREIILLHSGRIWMESKVGKGSQFYFTLSRAPDSLAG